MPVITVSLDKKTDRTLQRLAKETKQPKSYFIKKALHLYFEEFEDYRIAVARQAHADEAVLSLTQVRKAVGTGHRKDVYR